jgi:hypothetical protein
MCTQERSQRKWTALEIALYCLIIMSIILIGVLMPLAQKIYELDSKLDLKTKSDKESKYIHILKTLP